VSDARQRPRNQRFQGVPRWPVVALGFFLGSCTGPDEGPAGSAQAGAALVNKLCIHCHAVEANGRSPVAGAPPLAEVSRRYPPEELAEALAEGIAVGPHVVEMPEFAFEPEEIDDLIAFLETLRRTGRPN
jgi:cytochrome c